MKRALSIVFYVLGVFFLLGALARGAYIIVILSRLHNPELAERIVMHLIGLFIPSIVCFIVSAVLRKKKHPATEVAITSENRRDIVVLTPSAVDLARRIITDRRYPIETGLRIVFRPDQIPAFDVQYDLQSDDGRDWFSQSSGIVVLVAKSAADQLQGLMIDAKDGQFVYCSQRDPT